MPRLKVVTNLSFMIDTGADTTVLMPTDALIAHVPFHRLRDPRRVGGVGGTSQMFLEDAWLQFLDERGNGVLCSYGIQILVAARSKHLLATPSLLGRDVLDRWSMTYARPRRRLSFRVLSADLVEPISTRAIRQTIADRRAR